MEMVPSDMQPGENSYSGGDATVVEAAGDGMAVRAVGRVLRACGSWGWAMSDASCGVYWWSGRMVVRMEESMEDVVGL